MKEYLMSVHDQAVGEVLSFYVLAPTSDDAVLLIYRQYVSAGWSINDIVCIRAHEVSA